jgi:hypothetical protein
MHLDHAKTVASVAVTIHIPRDVARRWCDAHLLTCSSIRSWKLSCVLISTPTLARVTFKAHTTPLICLAFFSDTSVAEGIRLEPLVTAGITNIAPCKLTGTWSHIENVIKTLAFVLDSPWVRTYCSCFEVHCSEGFRNLLSHA